MPTDLRAAAQYIRMSTDRQDLSPLVQRERITQFARDNGFDVSRTYEDEGRSGVRISNRPGLRRLMQDVTEAPDFEAVLVYDVSRWGRFQDADASAYYEYHCRLHGVQVIYVAESFGNETPAPVATLLKNMKRLMAAEYSRDLATKARAGQERVIQMGFHMGPLLPLGYRRCGVSTDGQRRTVLDLAQRKLALTDRVKWVLASEGEVALVRRICNAYARSKLDLWQIARLAAAEGWRTVRGRTIDERCLRTLLRSEALIGNFVWGASDQNVRRRIIETKPTRKDGSVPRIIDDETWILIQKRLAEAPREDLRTVTLPPKQKKRRVSRHDLPDDESLRFGANDRRGHSLASKMLARTRVAHAFEFGAALAAALTAEGTLATFDRRRHSISMWGLALRLKLFWPCGDDWKLPKVISVSNPRHLLLVRMREAYNAIDFYLVPPDAAAIRRSTFSVLSGELGEFRCSSPSDLLDKIREMRRPPSKEPR